jgi:hypothetical protein
MRKIVLIVIVLVGLIVSASTGVYYWRAKTLDTQLVDSVSVQPPTPTPEELVVWKDQAGFSFEHPKSLVSDIHEEDQINYAHIELTHPTHPGRIIIWASDTSATSVSAWVKTQKAWADATMFDTSFAGLDATKLLLTTPVKKVITAVVSDAIVFYVEGEFDQSDFWTTTYETITSTFTLTGDPSVSAVSADQPSSGPESVDEEEVLE